MTRGRGVRWFPALALALLWLGGCHGPPPNGDGSADAVGDARPTGPPFRSLGRFAAGPSPTLVRAADVNGDGRADLVVANSPPSGMSGFTVLLGNADGTFQPPRFTPVGTRPVTALSVLDFNADGRLDVLVSDETEVRLGAGDGSFGAAQNVAIAAGDIVLGAQPIGIPDCPQPAALLGVAAAAPAPGALPRLRELIAVMLDPRQGPRTTARMSLDPGFDAALFEDYERLRGRGGVDAGLLKLVLFLQRNGSRTAVRASLARLSAQADAIAMGASSTFELPFDGTIVATRPVRNADGAGGTGAVLLGRRGSLAEFAAEVRLFVLRTNLQLGRVTASSVAPTLPNGTRQIATGDFTGDGVDDVAALVTHPSGANEVVCLESAPNLESLRAYPQTVGALPGVAEAETADVNRDGRDDLILSEPAMDSVEVLVSEGSIAATPPVNAPPDRAATETLRLGSDSDSAWVPNPGDLNPPCSPQNPAETSFASTAGGASLSAASADCRCCTCTRRSRSFALGEAWDGATARLRGSFASSRGAEDRFAVGSMLVELYHRGARTGRRTFAAENRPNNNCATERPETLVPQGGAFDVALSSVAAGPFDEVRVHLQGYACCTGRSSVSVSDLTLTRPRPTTMSRPDAGGAPCGGTDGGIDAGGDALDATVMVPPDGEPDRTTMAPPDATDIVPMFPPDADVIAPPDGGPAPDADAGPPSGPAVWLIVMEHHNWRQILGSPSAPYINNTLLPNFARAEQYHNPAGIHPALPNHLWIESGTGFGVTDDLPSRFHRQGTTDHLVSQLARAGVAWRSYAENIRGDACPLGDDLAGLYRAYRNPVVYFDDVTNGNMLSAPYCIAHVRPFEEFLPDLRTRAIGRFNYLVPNLCNAMARACAPSTDAIAQGDAWLAGVIPQIMASPSYTSGGIVFITFADGQGGTDGPIGMIVVSPRARRGYSNAIRYTHGSLLRTLETYFGLPLLRDAAAPTTVDLRDLFTSFP